jgi:hypothetical protein
MIQSASTIGAGGPKRIIVLPPNGPIFGYWLCCLQILTPGNLNIGTNKEEAGSEVGLLQDGLQFNQANTNNGAPLFFLWRGEMWGSASQNNFQFVLVIPGMEKPNPPCDLTTLE